MALLSASTVLLSTLKYDSPLSELIAFAEMVEKLRDKIDGRRQIGRTEKTVEEFGGRRGERFGKTTGESLAYCASFGDRYAVAVTTLPDDSASIANGANNAARFQSESNSRSDQFVGKIGGGRRKLNDVRSRVEASGDQPTPQSFRIERIRRHQLQVG